MGTGIITTTIEWGRSTMSDRYVHLDALPGGWDHRQENLLTLGRYLVAQAEAIRADGGLGFGEDMGRLDEAGPLPPLAFGPAAGLPAAAGESWPDYCRRVFGVYDQRPFMAWLQSPMWAKTDPSPEGAGLRIAYVLDYGVPADHVEIAMGQAYSDYDRNRFVWEKLRLYPPEGFQVVRKQPAWVGAVELNRRRAEAKADVLIVPGETPFSAGLPADRIAALAERAGVLPGSFSDLLLFAGRRAGADGVAYAETLEGIDRAARDRIFQQAREGDDPVPADAIFIGIRDGGAEFVPAGPRVDSPVFRFDLETGRVAQVAYSVFGWAEGFMREHPRVAVEAVDPPETSRRGWIWRLLGL